MDSYENEASKFAAQRTKLKNICEAHDLTYTFIKNSYPIKLIIRPIKGVGEQMSMLETASEDSYISPDAYLLFTMKDGVLVYRMSKTFTIEDALFGKIKNIFKNKQKEYAPYLYSGNGADGKEPGTAGVHVRIPRNRDGRGQADQRKNDLPAYGRSDAGGKKGETDISGISDTAELQNVLNAQNDSLRELVLEIVKDAEDDDFRGRYA